MSWSGLQSASQPRLSYAEMAEDYPRYPDIHDLDLTLLNPRMIVVSGAVPWGRDPREEASSPSHAELVGAVRASSWLGRRWPLVTCVVPSAGRHPVHEPFALHRFT